MIKSFVVLEGIDGSGTTTQLQRLANKFNTKAIKHKITCEPTDGPIGKVIRQALSGEFKAAPETVAYLFAADRAEHIYGGGGIYEAANNGSIVVSDRYLFSSLVYQGLTCGQALPEKLNQDFPIPELLFFLDIEPEAAVQRMASRKNLDIYEKLDFQQKVALAYKNVLKLYAKSDMTIINIDATLEPSYIEEIIWHNIEKVMGNSFNNDR